MGVLQAAGPLTNPEEMGRSIVGQVGTGVDPGQGPFKVQQQSLMAGVNIGSTQGRKVAATGLHELHSPVNFTGNRLVAGMGRVRGKALVPGMDRPQISEATLGKGPNQVKGRGTSVVAAQHALRIMEARLSSKIEAVDHFAAEGRQGDTGPGLIIRGTGLRELPGHAAHLDHGHGGTVGQHNSHLQQGTNPARNLIGSGPGKGLSTVTPLQEEGLALGHLGQFLAHLVYLTGKDQGRDGL